MSRFEILKPETMSPRQREIVEAIASGPRGGLKGPFLALIHSPELADRVQTLGEYLRFGTDLAPHLVEIPVLLTARFWNCDHEWAAHARIAGEAGLREAIISAIAQGQRPPDLDDAETLLFEFADETLRLGSPTDAAFDRLAGRYGKAVALDVLALCGYYTMLAFVLNTAQLPLPAGAQPLQPRQRPLP